MAHVGIACMASSRALAGAQPSRLLRSDSRCGMPSCFVGASNGFRQANWTQQGEKLCGLQSPVRARRARGQVVRMMSGVNGGIDYEIDLSSLPEDVARRVEYVQGGPDSPTALIDAAHAIAACRISSTLPVMVDMLGFNNPIAANIAIDALVHGGKDSVEFLLKGVGAFNYAVNAYALRALGRIGDPAVVDVCMECARGGPIPNVRRAACNALGQLLYNDQADCTGAVELLLLLLQDPDWSVRYASVSALHQFKQWQMIEDAIPSIRAQLEQVASQDSDRAVKARAHVALERYAT